MRYAEKLKDPRWQKKRLKILDNRGWACEICSDKEQTLHVHHTMYIDGLEPWEYQDYQLRVLCEDCHGKEHHEGTIKYMLMFLNRLGYTNIEIEMMMVFAFEKFRGGK